MIEFGKILAINPFGMPQKEKDQWFFEHQMSLTQYHYDNCKPYKTIVDSLYGGFSHAKSMDRLPFIPIRLFKKINLVSKPEHEIARILTSSGTSGGEVSKIHLDRKAILLQSRVLKTVFSSIFPKKNDFTIFIADSKIEYDKNSTIPASGAAVRGFSQFAKEIEFLLTPEKKLNLRPLKNYIEYFPERKFVIFGFTSPIWLDVVQNLVGSNQELPINNGICIHGGGWKKMIDQSVDKAVFNDTVRKALGVKSVHNYYGMVEQTGSVFVECEEGHFHPSIFSEVIIRNKNLEVAPRGEIGLIQVSSLLPESYPGHNLITDDLGALKGIDDCKCGRKGKYFSVIGRVPGSELRGCSDAN